MDERGCDTCVMEVSSHALSQHRVDGVRYDVARLHEPLPRPPRLPPDDGGLLPGQGRASSPRSARRAASSASTTSGGAGSPARPPSPSRPGVSRTTTVDGTTTRTGSSSSTDRPELAFRLVGPGDALGLRSALPGDFNRVNTALAAVGPAQARRSPPRTSPERSSPTPRPGPDGDGLGDPAPRTAARSPSSTTPTRPTPSPRRSPSLRPTTTGALVVVLGAGGDRDRQKRPAMGARRRAGADVVVVTDDNPRDRGPRRDPRRGRSPARVRRRRRAAIRSSVRRAAGPRSPRASRRRRAAGPASTVARPRQGPRDRPGDRRGGPPVRRPGRAPRRPRRGPAGGATA